MLTDPRSQEPPTLPGVRSKYTARWVDFYQSGLGKKPTDNKWVDYRGELADDFGDLCAYCEKFIVGQVDHLRPTSKYPQLVYVWVNWVYACGICNFHKLGYFEETCTPDPSQPETDVCPESLFTYDLETGELIVHDHIDAEVRQYALQFIDKLKLNNYHNAGLRRQHIKRVLKAIELVDSTTGKAKDIAKEMLDSYITSGAEYPTLTATVLASRID